MDEQHDFKVAMNRIHHLLRLGKDSFGLLCRAFDEGDLPPDLTVEIAEHIMRVNNLDWVSTVEGGGDE